MRNETTPTAQFSAIGTRPPRYDAADKATGRALFGPDIQLPGMLHGTVLRSTHAHARIRAIDTRRAEALPEVYAVVTATDLREAEDRIVQLGEGYDVLVNKPRMGPYRAPGATPASFVGESVVDELACKCKQPTALDVPPIECVIVEDPFPKHPFGVRGVGERPIVPPPAAIAAAIYRATGARMDQLPMTPGRILSAMGVI